MIKSFHYWKAKLQSSRFYLYVLKLSAGTITANAILILLSPVITRIYSASEFGSFSLYQSFVVILGTISTLAFDLSIIIPKDSRESKSLTVIALLLNSFSFLFFFGLFFVFKDFLSDLFDLPFVIVLLIPFGIFFHNTVTILSYWTTRQEGFGILSKSKILQSLINAFFQVSMGLMNLSGIGLQSGHIFARLSSSLYLVAKQKKRISYLFYKNSVYHLKKVSSKFKNYPKYVLTSNLLSIGGLEAPVILISIYYSAELVGFYGLSYRVLSVPFALIGTAIGQVYFQRLSDKMARHENIIPLLLKTWGGLFAVGLIPFVTIYFFGGTLFSFVFGPEWKTAGEIASICSPLLSIQFISASTGKSFLAIKKEVLMPFFSAIHFLARSSGIIIGILMNDFYLGLNLFVAFNIISLILYNGILVILIKQSTTSLLKK